jgi:hypothetical protein
MHNALKERPVHEEFAKHSEHELHLNVYGHRTVSHPIKESLYEQLKIDWIHRFETLSLQEERPSSFCVAENAGKTTHPQLSMGWALHKLSLQGGGRKVIEH